MQISIAASFLRMDLFRVSAKMFRGSISPTFVSDISVSAERRRVSILPKFVSDLSVSAERLRVSILPTYLDAPGSISPTFVSDLSVSAERLRASISPTLNFVSDLQVLFEMLRGLSRQHLSRTSQSQPKGLAGDFYLANICLGPLSLSRKAWGSISPTLVSNISVSTEGLGRFWYTNIALFSLCTTLTSAYVCKFTSIKS